MAPGVGDPRALHRQRAGQGRRRVPRGAGDVEGGSDMTTAGTATRADRLEGLLEKRELDALLVTNLVNVRWLTGFTGSNGLALVGPDLRMFATDFRYVEQSAEQVPDFERVRGKLDLFENAKERMSGRVGFDDTDLNVRQFRRL